MSGFDYSGHNAVVPGNIDLGRRPHVENPDGSIATIESTSFDEAGLVVLVPRVADAGYVMSESDARREYARTGRHLGKYPSVSDAEEAARAIQEMQTASPPTDTLAAEKAAGTYHGNRALFMRDLVLQVDTLRIEGLSISFDIAKSLSAKTPNTAEIRVWNLSAHHRYQLQQLERVYCSLEAGYRGSRSLIFRGDLRACTSARDGAHWITTVTSDTGRTARKKRIARSFAPGASVSEVLRSLASAMGLRIGNAQLAAAQARITTTRAAQFFNGYSVAGAISDELDRLTRTAGLEWSVQDDELQFLERGRPLQSVAVVLTPSTGLVGAAERGSTRGQAEARALMVPDIYPGRRVWLQSNQLKGGFRIEATKHRGGTAEREWYVDMTLKSEELAQ